MDGYYKNYVTQLHQFISDLHRYKPTEGTDKFLKMFDKLDLGKVLLRYYSVMDSCKDKLDNKDESLFDSPVVVVPNVDISFYWSSLNNGQKKKVWTNLQMLYIWSELMLHPESEESFNPYVGVGDTDKEYGVNEMFQGVDSMEDYKPEGPNISSVAKMVGLDKMFDVDNVDLEGLKDQLKNMSQEDIDEATNSLNGLLGQGDDKMKDFISDMLGNITEELKTDTTLEKNPLEGMMSIAESVAKKMHGKLDPSDFDIEKMMESTKKMASQCETENGVNPLDMVTQMMGTLDNQQMTEEECLAQYTSMMQNLNTANKPKKGNPKKKRR